MNDDRNIPIDTPFITLGSFLKLANAVGSGGEAKIRIREGEVMVNGEVEYRRGRKLTPDDRVTLDGVTFRVTVTSGETRG